MNRRKQLQFHIEEDDYFATVATVLNLDAEALDKGTLDIVEHSNYLKDLRDELMFLQENYKIVRREESDVTLF